jgi:hypothetical protein
LPGCCSADARLGRGQLQGQPQGRLDELEAQGYKIAKFKIDGNCYEIYGTNKDGKKVEIYFDTKSLDIVKAEIEK